MVGRRNRSRSTRNRPVTGECITTGQRLRNQAGSALVELLFNDPEVTKIQTDPSPSNLRAIRCYEKAGFERQRYRNHPRWSSRVHGSNTPGIRANAVLLTLPSRGTSRAGALGRLMSNVKHHEEAVIAEVSTQLSEVVGVIERHLEPTLLAVHLAYGSAVDGGLKPR